MLCNCLLTRRGLPPLFSLSKEGSLDRGTRGAFQLPWKCTVGICDSYNSVGVLSTLVQSEWTDYAHQEQTNKHYYEHPCIRKHNDTSITKAVQCYAIGFYKTDLVSYWAYFSTPFCFKRLRKLCLRKASKRPGLHYFYFSLLQKVSENTSHSKYKFFNKK